MERSMIREFLLAWDAEVGEVREENKALAPSENRVEVSLPAFDAKAELGEDVTWLTKRLLTPSTQDARGATFTPGIEEAGGKDPALAALRRFTCLA